MNLYNQDDSSGISSCCTGSEHQTSTHRVHSPFIPRHDDEVLLEVGDAVHVEREYDDHWCYGIIFHILVFTSVKLLLFKNLLKNVFFQQHK